MRTVAKVGLVGAGYVAAFAIASVVVASHIAATGGPDRQVYGAMFAFGDDLLFLAVLGVASVPATGAALFFLRPHRAFWRTLSVAAVTIASSSVAALVGNVARSVLDTRSGLQSLMVYASLGILVAPLFAMLFLLSGFFAPNRCARISLIVAGAVEIVVFAYWFHSLRGS
jgi:hypothetical protein